MRPLKLRLVVESATSPSPSAPSWMPRQGPQPEFITTAPACMQVGDVAALQGLPVDPAGGREDQHAGARRHLAARPGCRPRPPGRPAARWCRSRSRSGGPSCPPPRSTGFTLSTVCGQAICGASVRRRRSRWSARRRRPRPAATRSSGSAHARLLAQVAHGLLVRGHDAGGGARLDRHVAEHQPARRGHVADGLAVELDAPGSSRPRRRACR